MSCDSTRQQTESLLGSRSDPAAIARVLPALYERGLATVSGWITISSTSTAMVRRIVPFSDFEMRHWLSAFSSARRACPASIVGGMLRRACTSNSVNCGALSTLSSVPPTSHRSHVQDTRDARATARTSACSTLPPHRQEAFPGPSIAGAVEFDGRRRQQPRQSAGGKLDVIKRVARGDCHVSVREFLHGRFVALNDASIDLNARGLPGGGRRFPGSVQAAARPSTKPGPVSDLLRSNHRKCPTVGRWYPVGLILAAVLLMQAGTDQTEARSAPRLFDVTTAHGVFEGAPVEPADVFTPDESPIYVWFRCEGCTIGTVITSTWFYQEPEPPLRFAHGSETVETSEDFGEFHYDLRPGRHWSTGAYRIELRIDNILVAEAAFHVVANTHQNRTVGIADVDARLSSDYREGPGWPIPRARPSVGVNVKAVRGQSIRTAWAHASLDGEERGVLATAGT